MPSRQASRRMNRQPCSSRSRGGRDGLDDCGHAFPDWWPEPTLAASASALPLSSSFASSVSRSPSGGRATPIVANCFDTRGADVPDAAIVGTWPRPRKPRDEIARVGSWTRRRSLPSSVATSSWSTSSICRQRKRRTSPPQKSSTPSKPRDPARVDGEGVRSSAEPGALDTGRRGS